MTGEDQAQAIDSTPIADDSRRQGEDKTMRETHAARLTLNARPRGLARLVSVFLVIAGSLVLIGWKFDIQSLKSMLSAATSMKPNTAGCFILAGLSLWLRLPPSALKAAGKAAVVQRSLATLLALSIVIISGLTLIEYLFNWNPGFDQWLFPEHLEVLYPGRMALITAVNFVLAGLSLLLFDLQIAQRYWPYQLLVVVILLTTSIGFLDITLLPLSYHRGMAIHAILFFYLLAAGMLAAHPDRGFMTTINSSGMGGMMARRLMPAAFALPILLSWLRWAGQQASLYDTPLGIALMGAATIAMFSTMIWWTAASLNQADAQRQAAEEASKAMQSALIESAEAFRTLAEAVPQVVWVCNPDGMNIYFNQRWGDYTGMSLEESYGTGWNAPFHAEDKQRAWEAWERATKNSEPYDLECRLRQYDGSYHWFLIRGVPLRDATGDIVKWFGTCTDIDQLKIAEEAVRRNQERLELTQQAARIGSFEWNIQTNVNIWSKELEALYGLEPRAFVGTLEAWAAYLYPEDRIKMQEDLRQALGDGHLASEWRVVWPDGTIHWLDVRARVYLDTDGQPLRMLGINIEITERRQAEEELRRIQWMLKLKPQNQTLQANEETPFLPAYGDVTALNTEQLILRSVGKESLSNIVNDYLDLLQTSAAVYEKNGDYAHGIFSSGWCQFMDQSSRNLCGEVDNTTALNSGNWKCHESCWSETSLVSIQTNQPTDIACQGGIRLYAVPIRAGGEIIGSINFGYGDPPHDPARLAQLAAQYEVSEEELRRRSLAYESRPPAIIEMAKRRLQSSARLIGEIVERKIAEQQLAERTRELERSNADLERFAYVASHDLQEPLRMVASYTQLLAKRYEGKLDDKADQYIHFAVDGAQRMQQLINDLLNFARIGTQGKPFELLDCDALFAHTKRSLQIAIAETEAVITADPLPVLMGDEVQLAELFQNLLSNALKFHSQEPPRIHVSAKLKGSAWIFSVQDNGIGLKKQFQERIFVIFQRLHSREEYPGTGMGLAIAARIVERHHGRIWVESDLGKGATFYFTLPALMGPTGERKEAMNDYSK
ncbi:MAG: PAS domain-containing protein [Acidobacteria bacterium]|nr:PAS domain-containing protein [Acidobacteriota bacterium]